MFFRLWYLQNPPKAGNACFNSLPLHVPSLPFLSLYFHILIISVCLDLDSPGKCARDKLIQLSQERKCILVKNILCAITFARANDVPGLH
jgi:hypothetical protein